MVGVGTMPRAIKLTYVSSYTSGREFAGAGRLSRRLHVQSEKVTADQHCLVCAVSDNLR